MPAPPYIPMGEAFDVETRLRHLVDHIAQYGHQETPPAAAAEEPETLNLTVTEERTGDIPETDVVFDEDGGHDHATEGTPVPFTGDVTGTNQATTVELVQNVPFTAPTAAEDEQLVAYEHGTGFVYRAPQLSGAAPTGWSAVNHTPTRTLDAATATLPDVVNVLCTLIEDLLTRGVIAG